MKVAYLAHVLSRRGAPERAPGVHPHLAGPGLALAGAAILVVGFVRIASTDPSGTELSAAVTVGLIFGLGPALLSSSLLLLAREMGMLSRDAVVPAGVAAVGAWGLTALASAAWGAGFRQADLGVERTAFTEAFPVLGISALVCGSLALSPLYASLLHRVGRVPLRWALAVACADPTAVLIGLLTLSPGSGLLAAVGVLSAWGWWRRAQPVDPRPDQERAAAGPPG